MILRRNADVSATDGPFGWLSDLVIEPATGEITHLVVTPSGRHRQPRLVPIWLVAQQDEGIRIELDSPHVVQLQRVLGGDFTGGRAEDYDLGPDVRFKTILLHPFVECAPGDADMSGEGVAREDCEIRCDSDVLSSNDRRLGRVAGFLMVDGIVRSVIVRSGLVGWEHDVAVPVRMVAEVHPDMIVLDLDRHEFRALPQTKHAPLAKEQLPRREQIANASARILYNTRDHLALRRKDLLARRRNRG